MGLIRRLVALAVLAVGAALIGTAAYIYLYTPPETLPEGAQIVVLSAGLDGAEMAPQTAERTERGIAVYQSLTERGETPLLVMSGGRSGTEPAAKATLMGDAARDAGVPVGALRIEANSHSTLQNALFSREALGPAAEGPLILVTHRYHLPRAWASFRWAGMDDLTLIAAEDVDAPPELEGLLAEGIKWPVNLIRGGGYALATSIGLDETALVPLLR